MIVTHGVLTIENESKIDTVIITHNSELQTVTCATVFDGVMLNNV